MSLPKRELVIRSFVQHFLKAPNTVLQYNIRELRVKGKPVETYLDSEL